MRCVPVAVEYVTPLGVDLGHADGRYNPNAQADELPFGGGGQAFRERGQHARRGIEQQDPRLLGMDGAEIVAQGIVGDLGQRSGEFHAGGSRADDHKRQPAAAGLGIGLALGGFEGVEDFVADASGVFERLETGRDGFPRVFVAEVEVARSRGDDQSVVGDRRLCPESDVRLVGSRSTASASRTWAFFCLRSRTRSGAAISPGDNAPVATW